MKRSPLNLPMILKRRTPLEAWINQDSLWTFIVLTKYLDGRTDKAWINVLWQSLSGGQIVRLYGMVIRIISIKTFDWIVFLPDPVGHGDVPAWLSIQVCHQRELCIKTLLAEQFVEAGCQQTLVKFVVNLSSIDALSHQSAKCIPWYLLWWQVGTTLANTNHSSVTMWQLYIYIYTDDRFRHGMSEFTLSRSLPPFLTLCQYY